MARAGRLTSAADFRRTYAEGRRAASREVVAHVAEARGDGGRIGISTARGLRTSVQRNRAKRRLREAARTLRPEVRDDVDIVLVASAAASEAAFQDMVNSLRETIRRAGGCR